MTDFRSQVKQALIWRSGMQIAAQSVQWILTLVVIRLLVPRDYGLIAMTEVVTAFLAILAGYSFTSAIVQAPDVAERQIRQFFGLLLVINVALAAIQVAAAPLAAAYYREPVVADMLRVQAINYLMIPFITLPQALASRRMEFRSPAMVHFVATISSGVAVVTLAWMGAGVWSLVIGTVVLHVTRAIGMAVMIRWLVWPIFRFDGTAHLLTYGGAVMGNTILWFFYAQADIFIGGRYLSAHDLGLYSTGLFLALLPIQKFLPALNEVAFTAYSRIQDKLDAVRANYLRSTRMVTMLLFPMFFGLAAVAELFVPVVLGPQWVGTVPIIQTIAVTMPIYAVYNLTTPLLNALGKPRVGLANSFIGVVVMPLAFLIGVRWGAIGLAQAWLVGFPIVFLVTTWNSLRAIRMGWWPLIESLVPATVSGVAMGGAVFALSRIIALEPVAELVVLIAAGGAVYAAVALLLFRDSARDMVAFARKRGA